MSVTDPQTAAIRRPTSELQHLVCVRHPDRETLLRCSKCEQPFCTDCLVPTPVGHRCYACAGVRRSTSAARYGRAMAVTLAIAAGTAAIGALVGRMGGIFLTLLLALVAGAAIAGVLGPLVTRRTRAAVLTGGVAALLLGAVLGRLVVVLLLVGAVMARAETAGMSVSALLLQALLLGPLDTGYWLFVGVTGVVAYLRLR